MDRYVVVEEGSGVGEFMDGDTVLGAHVPYTFVTSQRIPEGLTHSGRPETSGTKSTVCSVQIDEPASRGLQSRNIRLELRIEDGRRLPGYMNGTEFVVGGAFRPSRPRIDHRKK